MSGKSEYSRNDVPGDTETKTLDDDLFESSRTDSGFISSGNMIVSEEIIDEPEVKNEINNFDKKIKEDKGVMLIDSGVCLSENFSNLSLKNSNLNNLSSNSNKNVECGGGKSDEVRLNVSDKFWKTYYDQDENGDTQLHLAIGNRQMELAYRLICHNPHPRLLDTPNDDALTPLHLAVMTHQPYVVRWLIVAGARPGPRDAEGNSPLHIACKMSYHSCAQCILYPVQNQELRDMNLSYSTYHREKYDLDQWNYNGQTCVHLAALRSDVYMVRLLMCYGANINAKEGLQGNTALHYAVRREDENLVRFLLLQCPNIDFNIKNYGRRNVFDPNCTNENIAFLLTQRGVLPQGVLNGDDDSSEDSDSDNDV